MEFKLKPYNRDLPDKELLQDLRLVAKKLRKDNVTKDEYNEHGRLCAATFQKRFGSWSQAHELAGLRIIRHFRVTPEECIKDIQRVADLLKTDCITTEDYKQHGKFSLPLISRKIGSWNQAIQNAKLKISPNFKKFISDDDLFQNIEQLWEKLGRQPTRKDFIKPLSLYGYGVYPKRFGTFRKALEAFINSLDQANITKQEEKISVENDTLTKPKEHLHKTSRSISWRMRFLVLKRDNFKCRSCGASPSTNAKTELEVDHVYPWSKGGETQMDNLQTLCKKCNRGKSNLIIE